MTPEKIGVIGLGYVGLPVALALGRHFPGLVGFDINERRIAELHRHEDRTGEAAAADLKSSTIAFTTEPAQLQSCNFYIVTVPTPINDARQPDLTPIIKASETIGKYLKRGDIVVYESTVYPGVTEDICGGLLEKASGLVSGRDFHLGYSPERINPGDKTHRLETIIKVISAQNDNALARMEAVYGAAVTAGLHKAPSIKVAEAAKVIENTQRDLNIAFMNELALMFDRMGLRTKDVLAAAGTKWNFLNFTPGLVGGHCIGVDPYYLTALCQQIGYHPEVILAGRRINDSMGSYIAGKLVKFLALAGKPVAAARVGVLGLTFKENVPDLRNSKVFDIIRELKEFGISPLAHDPVADAADAAHESGLTLTKLEDFRNLDALVIAVGHDAYKKLDAEKFKAMLAKGGIVIDIKSLFGPDDFAAFQYWSL